MSLDSNKKTDDGAEIDRELISKLFSTGFTILSIGFPAMAGALAALRDPGISSTLASGLRGLVWLLLPAVVICAAQSLLCLGVVTGFFKRQRLAYMMLSIIIWSLVTILG